MSVHSAWETEPVGQRIPPRIIGLLSTQEDLFHPHPHIKAKHDHIHKPVALGMVEWRQADPQSTLVSPSHQPPVNTRASERRCIHRWRGWWLRKTYVTRLYHTHTHKSACTQQTVTHALYIHKNVGSTLCFVLCGIVWGSCSCGLHCLRSALQPSMTGGCVWKSTNNSTTAQNQSTWGWELLSQIPLRATSNDLALSNGVTGT